MTPSRPRCHICTQRLAWQHEPHHVQRSWLGEVRGIYSKRLGHRDIGITGVWILDPMAQNPHTYLLAPESPRSSYREIVYSDLGKWRFEVASSYSTMFAFHKLCYVLLLLRLRKDETDISVARSVFYQLFCIPNTELYRIIPQLDDVSLSDPCCIPTIAQLKGASPPDRRRLGPAPVQERLTTHVRPSSSAFPAEAALDGLFGCPVASVLQGGFDPPDAEDVAEAKYHRASQ
ncbi:uncharacterized protein BJX67DRAFT_229423 [Aspergillus lucknowensis]|uniref:Uncharacterized protein n=1 Tax=Aspergillus lucknowensis TaxID=176173 RepID=A0ABR4LHL9_9EURO